MAIWKRINHYRKKADSEEFKQETREKMDALEGKDIPALLISSFLSLFIPAVLCLLILCALSLLIFLPAIF